MQMSNSGQIVRLWVFSLLFTLWSVANANAQGFQTVTKVTKDSVCLKWLPTDYSAMLKLKDGATVSRIEVKSSQALTSQNYESGKKWTIAPLKGRFDALDRQDSIQDRMATLLDPIVTPVSVDAQNFAFGSVLIENVTQPLFQYELGNLIVDISFDKQKKYAYRITVKNADPIFVFVDPSSKKEIINPVIELALDQKKTVVCSWDVSLVREQYFAFDIEHSIADTKNPKPLFKEPYLPFKSEFEKNQDEAEIRHENAEKGKMHYYRVIGRDAFGASGNASYWQGIYVPNRIEAYPIIDSVTIQGTNRLVHAHIEAKNNRGIENAQLVRSEERDKGYELVQSIPLEGLKSKEFIFTAETAIESGDAYYYMLELMNEDDTVYSQPFYHFTLDQVAPDAPHGLEVRIDSNGIAALQWNTLVDTGLLGYRVFRGNSKNEEFAERTNELSLETSWTDTLALDNLTSEVYYYIQGVDNNYNQGAHSDTVMGLKPDTIAPVSGLIRKISMIESGIELDITLSTSIDAISNILYRDEVSLGEVGEAYIDTSLVPGRFYTYRIVTEDRSGNRSESKAISQKYEPGFRTAPRGSIRADFQGNFIEINFELPELEIYSIQIYRAKKGEASRRWKTIHDLEQKSVQDHSIRIGETYAYQVKYITKDGVHSLPLELEVSF